MANSGACHAPDNGIDTRQGRFYKKHGDNMGRQIYLTDKEIESLYDSVSEWCSIMSDGEDTAELTEIRLKQGLGSAMYKLSKGTGAEKVYKRYAKG